MAYTRFPFATKDGAWQLFERDLAASLPLTPAQLHILLILAGGERHGYSILREIERRQPQVRIGPATLYRAIKQLLEKGWIVETEERPDPALDDERRHYYRLSDLGRRIAQLETRRLAQLVADAHDKGLLGNQEDGADDRFSNLT